MTLPYPTLVGRGMLRRLPDVVRDAGKGNRVALITDVNVARRYGAKVAKLLKLGPADRFTIPAGEVLLLVWLVVLVLYLIVRFVRRRRSAQGS